MWPDSPRFARAALQRVQRGMILVELVMALGIASAVTLGFIQLNEDNDRRTRATLAAQQALTIGQAMQSYINDRYALLLTQATTTRPALITVPELVTAGYLPNGTTARDAYGLNLCALVIAVPGSPSSRLQGLMVAESRTVPALTDLDLGRLTATLGGAGGAVYNLVGTSPATVVQGTSAAWSIPVAGAFSAANHQGRRCDGSAGAVALSPGRYMVALWYGKTFNNEDVLYSNAIPGRADLNTMRTPLGLFVDSSGSVAFGAGCTQVGQIATDARGVSLTCRADNSGNRRWGNAYFVDSAGSIVRFGAACTLNGSYATDASGVPMVCKGGVWGVFNYVDSSGAAGVGFGKPCAASMTGATAADAAGTPLSCKAGYWVMSLPSDASAVQGAACSVGGALATDPTGLPFICRSGEWRRLDVAGKVREVSFSTAGSYRWRVPDGVTWVWLTMAGGGASGVPPSEMNPNDDLPYSAWWTVGGDSGGFLQNRPISVVAGTELCIAVGRGGNMVPPGSYHRWVLASNNVGQDSTVQACSGSVPTAITCSGGGRGTGCNVKPSMSIRGKTLESSLALVSFSTAGGSTPIEAGSGGGTSVVGCGFGCGSSNRSFGQPGTNGAVHISWTE